MRFAPHIAGGFPGIILETDPDWGKRYIRKIIQIPFPVPSISMGSFDKYIGNCIKDSGIASHLGENESWNGIIRETCQSNLREVKRLINHFISEMDKSWANAQASDLTLQESLDRVPEWHLSSSYHGDSNNFINTSRKPSP